jgi:predicted TIM-barrel fold metal-dependent hydrolase
MISRRRFIGALGAAGTVAMIGEVRPSPAPRRPIIDAHVHLAGVGDGGSGSFLSARQRDHWNYPLFLKLLNLREGSIDEDFIATLVEQLRTSSIDRALLFAQDGRYDSNGDFDRGATNSYVPNEYLFEIVNRFPNLFIPCCSINPKRRDALDELEHCAEQGARALKIHPPVQDVDPALPEFRPFYRRAAELGIVVIVHTGSEHATQISSHDLGDPARLLTALDEGCTVVAAHTGMGSFLDDRVFDDGMLQNLIALIARFENLYCDSAVLASTFRWQNLPRIMQEPAVLARLIHASDWPFTSNAIVFWNRLAPWEVAHLTAEKNLFERDYQLKRALGLPVEVFERAALLYDID